MGIVNGSLQEGYKDAAWFAANPTLVLLIGQKVNLEQTGTYKLGDGTTQLSALSFLGGSGSALSGLTTNKVLKAGSATTAVDSNITDDGTSITISSPNNQNLVVVEDNNLYIQYLGTTNAGGLTYLNTYVDLQHDARVNLNAPSVTKNGDEVATVNDIPTYPNTYNLFITTGNQTTTSNIAANITDLVSPTLTINKRYKISGVIRLGCNNTGGTKLQIVIPTGSTIAFYGIGLSTSTTVTTQHNITTSATLFSVAVNQFNGNHGLIIQGEVQMSSTTGVIQFGFASTTNTQTSTVYQLGTQLTLTQIN